MEKAVRHLPLQKPAILELAFLRLYQTPLASEVSTPPCCAHYTVEKLICQVIFSFCEYEQGLCTSTEFVLNTIDPKLVQFSKLFTEREQR